MTAYYNEIDPYAAQWLRNLIAENLIAPGDVDERSIVDVRPDDLAGYTQCHFFAGIGGWSYAARLAGWPDDRPLWTGSCPCQPFSLTGKQKGRSDKRHLWPTFFELIRACRPDVVVGEQVAAAVGHHWLDGVHSDLESIGYAAGATIIPACAVDAPHRRDRLWFVADANSERGRARNEAAQTTRYGHSSFAESGHVGNALRNGAQHLPRGGDRSEGSSVGKHRSVSRAGLTAWSDGAWSVGGDGKARRIEPRIRLLADGLPERVGKLRAYGNAIVPQVAAEVIGAYLEAV